VGRYLLAPHRTWPARGHGHPGPGMVPARRARPWCDGGTRITLFGAATAAS